MKYPITVLSVALCPLTARCGEPTQNRKRPSAPPLAKLTTYKSSPENIEGTILKEEFFDGRGNLVKFVAYDYYGSGEVDGTTTYEYDDAGHKTRQDDGLTVTTYTYDDQGRLATETWKRGDKGSVEERRYDDRGNLVESRYLDLAGNHDFSRTYDYTYDAGGRIATAIKWERYTDGTADMQMYNIQYMYDAAGRQVEKRSVNANGSFHNLERSRYDGRGNLIETLEFDDDPAILSDKNVSQFNPYGEMVESRNYSCAGADQCGDAWSTTTYTYDEYGNSLGYMLRQAHDADFGERVTIEYRSPASSATP